MDRGVRSFGEKGANSVGEGGGLRDKLIWGGRGWAKSKLNYLLGGG